MIFFDESSFIQEYITERQTSLLAKDLQNNSSELTEGIKDKSVLVIGGAGTIGSSFIKALLPFRPGALTVVDYSENGLTELTRDLRSSKIFIPDHYLTYPFDFGGPVFEKLIDSQSYDIVACFAAHKHVRSEKDHLAVEAMIRNNVLNTHQLLKQLQTNPPEHFFCVSTDKAANPVNVMGASKKMMEKVLMAYSSTLKITTARFANVAFSNGSLLQGFVNRIYKRQPLSSPSDVRRYFVSPIESGQLCLIACILGHSGQIIFPKLHEDQMKTFSSIAESFLSSIGYECDYCSTEEEAKLKAKNWSPSNKSYPVYFFETNTSGEKMFEEFYTHIDSVDMEKFNSLGVINRSENVEMDITHSMLDELKELFNRKNLTKSKIVSFLTRWITDFGHIETGKNLDQRM